MSARAALATGLAACLAALCACSGEEPATPEGRTLLIYSSLPAHGLSAEAARSVIEGQRRALADAGNSAGGRSVRLVGLPSTETGDEVWDPELVSANAERAAEDPAAVAYVGELDYGGSAVSVPITNAAGLLQVAPADGLASLVRRPPGAREGPERYYPEGRRSFLALVPDDAGLAEGLAGLIAADGARKLGLVVDESVYGRELAGAVSRFARRARVEPVVSVEDRDEEGQAGSLARELAEESPDAVVYAGTPGAEFGELARALERELPGVELWGGAGLAAADAGTLRYLSPLLPPAVYSPAARRAMERLGGDPLSLYGYESVRVVLDAIESAGPTRADVLREVMRQDRPAPLVDPPARYALYAGGAGRARFQQVVP